MMALEGTLRGHCTQQLGMEVGTQAKGAVLWRSRLLREQPGVPQVKLGRKADQCGGQVWASAQRGLSVAEGLRPHPQEWGPGAVREAGGVSGCLVLPAGVSLWQQHPLSSGESPVLHGVLLAAVTVKTQPWSVIPAGPMEGQWGCF